MSGSTMFQTSAGVSTVSSTLLDGVEKMLDRATPAINTTTSPWRQKEIMAMRVAAPIILTFGTVGNTMAILVLRRMSSKTSTFTLFFTALAVSDLCLLYVGLVPTWLEFQFGVVVQTYSDTTCKLIPWMYYSLGMLSAWLLVAMTVQRAVCVMWPHRKRLTHARRKALVTVAILVLSCFGMNSHLLYGSILKDQSNLHRACGVKQDHRSFYDVWSWLELVFFSLLPFLIIIVSNCLLMYKVLQAARDVQETLRVCRTDHNSHTDSLTWMNLTLITVSVAFIVLTLPACVMTILGRHVNPALWSVHEKYHFYFWRMITDMLWFANSALNFYLYILTVSATSMNYLL
nr:hypothetical protein BaRGS_018588 [Batillaria attramentaria]